MNKFTPEIIEKAKVTKNIEELQMLAKENGIEMTDEEAKAYYEQLHVSSGEIDDDELDNVAGGGCHKKDGRLIVTIKNTCYNWTCEACGRLKRGDNFCEHLRVRMFNYKPYCKNCQYMSYEKGLWLCNNPLNME